MCGSPNISPTTSRPPGFRTRATSRSACSWSGISPEHRDEHGRVEGVVVVRERLGVAERGRDVGDAAPVGLPHHVVEHLLLDVEDVDLAAVQRGRHLEGVVARAGPDLEHALAGRGREHLEQAACG